MKWFSCENFESGLKMRVVQEKHLLTFKLQMLTDCTAERQLASEKKLNENTATVHYQFDRSCAIGIGTRGRSEQLVYTHMPPALHFFF